MASGSALAEDAQGRLILAGVAELDGGAQCLGLMRFSTDGLYGPPHDTGFGTGDDGKICHAQLLGDGVILGRFDLDIAMQSDGRILVGGLSYGGNTHPYVCRFFADGGKDASFGAQGPTPGCVRLTQIDTGYSWPAPALLVRGQSLLLISNDDGGNVPVMARLALGDGSVEPFGQQDTVPILPGSVAALDAFAWDAALTQDGDVVVVGAVEVDIGDNDFFVVRFDPLQGKPVVAFNGSGMVRIKFSGDGEALSVDVGADDIILVAGYVSTPGGSAIGLVQLAGGTGMLDPTFNSGHPVLYDPCDSLLGVCYVYFRNVDRSPSGHIVLGGEGEDDGGPDAMFAVRLHADGSPDPNFGSSNGLTQINITGSDAGASGMILQGERIVLGGYADADDDDFALVRLSDGRLFRDGFDDAP